MIRGAIRVWWRFVHTVVNALLTFYEVQDIVDATS